MKTYLNPKKNEWAGILKRPIAEKESLEAAVSEILKNVKLKGDRALLSYTEKLDRVKLSSVKVSEKEINDSFKNISPELSQALKTAAKNIYKFHNLQLINSEKIRTMPGVTCWRKSSPIEKVGLYIPGGTAPLFSTVLMLGIPAKIAGCRKVILSTPPDKDGNIPPAILAAAKIAGITRIYKAGGAQAIAAMAYGTETIPKVYKIFGPGNQYVNCAKNLVSREGTAIDLPAGPSELLILADRSARPDFIAADLLSQAEHGEDSQVILVSTDKDIIKETLKEIDKQLNDLPRCPTAKKSLSTSKCILIKNMNRAIELINDYAPEHLIIACTNAEKILTKVKNAGSVFLGNYSPESAGDYASGTNHTLPTNGFARIYGGVSVDHFVKKITIQKITKKGLQKIGKTIEIMAEAEQLMAHKNAVTIRLKNKK